MLVIYIQTEHFVKRSALNLNMYSVHPITGNHDATLS
jgi:hypothetical protein